MKQQVLKVFIPHPRVDLMSSHMHCESWKFLVETFCSVGLFLASVTYVEDCLSGELEVLL
jgi:hypothetical protein